MSSESLMRVTRSSSRGILIVCERCAHISLCRKNTSSFGRGMWGWIRGKGYGRGNEVRNVWAVGGGGRGPRCVHVRVGVGSQCGV